MVLLDSAYWRDTLPVERLLRQLAARSRVGALVAALDDVDEVVAFLESNPARRVRVS